ncbi:MAG: isochorismatase-like [Paenibacillaceae bacterium]|jgi:nicotinamidase-related amidase|nr:isochorismatase-like [Paenibacillaceae bacterium]
MPDSGLLIIDIQNDYFPGGKWMLHQPEEAAAKAAQAIAAYRKKGLPVFHIRHESLQPGAAFFHPGTTGAELHPLAAPAEGERVLLKHVPNAFSGTALHEELQAAGIQQLTVCGMMTHMCIDTSVRAARDLGYAVTLLEDACATRDLEWQGERLPADTVQKTMLAALNGTFARILRVEQFLETLA